jgi:hypothetical protein
MDYFEDLFERLENENLRPGIKLPIGLISKSDLTIAWEARNESKKLNDPNLIEPLKKRLEKEKITKKRINIINVLVSLANNIGEHSVADYVISVVRKEKIRWIRFVALDALNESNIEIQTEKDYLFDLVEEKDWQIQLNALNLLKRLDASYSSKIEDTCINLIDKNAKKPNVLSSIGRVLAKHGTIKAIKPMKDIAKNNNKAYVVNCALNAIAKISGSQELDFFIQIFNDNNDKEVKSAAIEILCDYGDKNVIDLLINRAKKILLHKKKKQVTYFYDTKPELVHILGFLIKFKEEKIDKLLAFIITQKMDFMDDTERQWFINNVIK